MEEDKPKLRRPPPKRQARERLSMRMMLAEPANSVVLKRQKEWVKKAESGPSRNTANTKWNVQIGKITKMANATAKQVAPVVNQLTGVNASKVLDTLKSGGFWVFEGNGLSVTVSLAGKYRGDGIVDWLDMVRTGVKKVASDSMTYVKKPFDLLKDKANAVFDPNLEQYTNAAKASLQKVGNKVITKMDVVRTPVQGFIDKAFQILTLGKWEQLKRKYGYEQFFHLAIECELEGGDRVKIEKNDRIDVNTSWKVSNREARLNVPLDGVRVSVYDLMDKTRKRVGDAQFFLYDAFGDRNCQSFIRDLLQTIGRYTEAAKAFVYQPVDELAKELPEFSKKLSKGVTDLSGRVSLFLGKGSKKSLKEYSPNNYIGGMKHITPSVVDRPFMRGAGPGLSGCGMSGGFSFMDDFLKPVARVAIKGATLGSVDPDKLMRGNVDFKPENILPYTLKSGQNILAAKMGDPSGAIGQIMENAQEGGRKVPNCVQRGGKRVISELEKARGLGGNPWNRVRDSAERFNKSMGSARYSIPLGFASIDWSD